VSRIIQPSPSGSRIVRCLLDLNLQNEVTMISWNVHNYQPNNTVPHHRRLKSSSCVTSWKFNCHSVYIKRGIYFTRHKGGMIAPYFFQEPKPSLRFILDFQMSETNNRSPSFHFYTIIYGNCVSWCIIVRFSVVAYQKLTKFLYPSCIQKPW